MPTKQKTNNSIKQAILLTKIYKGEELEVNDFEVIIDILERIIASVHTEYVVTRLRSSEEILKKEKFQKRRKR